MWAPSDQDTIVRRLQETDEEEESDDAYSDEDPYDADDDYGFSEGAVNEEYDAEAGEATEGDRGIYDSNDDTYTAPSIASEGIYSDTAAAEGAGTAASASDAAVIDFVVDLSRPLGITLDSGARVSKVLPAGQCAAAAIATGDQIVSVDVHTVSGSRMKFRSAVEECKAKGANLVVITALREELLSPQARRRKKETKGHTPGARALQGGHVEGGTEKQPVCTESIPE